MSSQSIDNVVYFDGLAKQGVEDNAEYHDELASLQQLPTRYGMGVQHF